MSAPRMVLKIDDFRFGRALRIDRGAYTLTLVEGERRQSLLAEEFDWPSRQAERDRLPTPVVAALADVLRRWRGIPEMELVVALNEARARLYVRGGDGVPVPLTRESPISAELFVRMADDPRPPVYVLRGTVARETDKAYGVDVGDLWGRLLWVPKSQVLGRRDKGLVVSAWWAEQHLTPGGPVARYEE